MDFEPDIDLDSSEDLPFRRRVGAPCPKCGLYSSKGYKNCPHCNYRFTRNDLLNAEHFRESKTKFGMVSGFIIMPIIMLILILFSNW
jgi:hypothetical protein